MMGAILIVDDEEGIRSFLQEALELDDYDVVTAADGIEALGILKQHGANISLMLTDLKMPHLDGIGLLQRSLQHKPDLTVIMLTAHGSIDVAVEAMKLGAFDFLQKPLKSPKELREMVKRALAEKNNSPKPTPAPTNDAPPLSHGASSMIPVVDALQKVAPTQATVLLTGESGTGKEVAARKLHMMSQRADGPFIAINCAALAEQLIESELFGHEKGAFTGADSLRKGRIEQAEGGTFFLDEIGELKLETQAKWLRVLQENAYTRVGGQELIHCDVRWIAATNRDLPTLVNQGLFREDLYHRLAVFPIHLPPLRERTTDILPIAEYLLQRVARQLGRATIAMTSAFEQALTQHAWPGNVRELSNALERASIMAGHEPLDVTHLALPNIPLPTNNPNHSAQTLAEVEKETIARALDAVGGNRRQAAKRLGIAERTLYDKIKRYDLS